MKQLKRFLKEIFAPETFNNLDTSSISAAFNDPSARARWLLYCFEEIQRINMDVDRRLLSGSELALTDLCARRKAFQDILEQALLCARKQGDRPNPRPLVEINLDRVTA